LIKLIVHTVTPDSWQEKGGKGSIDYFPTTMSLVVHQTCEVHAQIAEMFKTMRQHQDVQVALEVRFVTVCEPTIERIGIDCECPNSGQPVASCPKEGKPADDVTVTFLQDKQVLKLLESVQKDPRACIMQAPKLTTFNGQCASLNLTDQQSFVTGLQVMQIDGEVVCKPVNETITSGVRLNFQPVVSADRRSVRVSLNANLDGLGSPSADLIPIQIPVMPKCADGTPDQAGKPVMFTQYIQKPRLNKIAIDRTLCIPDGGTAVLSGWKHTRENRTECGTPVLSKIPYVNRLFKNVGCERVTEHLLVLVTPRIIVSAEEEKGLFEEEEEMCWPFGKESAPCPTPDCCKEKGGIEAQSTGCAMIPLGDPMLVKPVTCEVAELLEKYHKACLEGRRAEATELAVRALALDPTCFHKAVCGSKGEK
jgi:general secretion pathway protein D